MIRSKSFPGAKAILSLLLFKERLFSRVNFPIIIGGRLSILLLDKSMVLRLVVSFCNSEGNWRKGFTARRISHRLTSPSRPTLPWNSHGQVPPSLTSVSPRSLSWKTPVFCAVSTWARRALFPILAQPLGSLREGSAAVTRSVEAHSHPVGLPVTPQLSPADLWILGANPRVARKKGKKRDPATKLWHFCSCSEATRR